MITVTDSAREQALRLMKNEKKDSAFIRVGVKGGGCSGLMYEMAFETNIRVSDLEYNHNGIRIVIDKKSLLYLAGTTLDYQGGLNGKGFIFLNPNANRTCGCGESFSV